MITKVYNKLPGFRRREYQTTPNLLTSSWLARWTDVFWREGDRRGSWGDVSSKRIGYYIEIGHIFFLCFPYENYPNALSVVKSSPLGVRKKFLNLSSSLNYESVSNRMFGKFYIFILQFIPKKRVPEKYKSQISRN